MAELDARTIAADIMTGNARSITVGEIWAHIGQAYDATDIDASIADEVNELIAEAGIDLIWPDGSKDTELDAARVEIERLRAELDQARAEADALRPHADGAEVRDSAGTEWFLDEDRWMVNHPGGERLAWAELDRAYGPLTVDQQPCGICSGYGCPDCRDDLSGVAR